MSLPSSVSGQIFTLIVLLGTNCSRPRGRKSTPRTRLRVLLWGGGTDTRAPRLKPPENKFNPLLPRPQAKGSGVISAAFRPNLPPTQAILMRFYWWAGLGPPVQSKPGHRRVAGGTLTYAYAPAFLRPEAPVSPDDPPDTSAAREGGVGHIRSPGGPR